MRTWGVSRDDGSMPRIHPAGFREREIQYGLVEIGFNDHRTQVKSPFISVTFHLPGMTNPKSREGLTSLSTCRHIRAEYLGVPTIAA
jgi:hypothetical protein